MKQRLKLEVLVATIDKVSLDFINDLNIDSNIVISNQTNSYFYEEKKNFNNRNRYIKMYNILNRGVGKNRNNLIANSTSDICLLADDDIYYYNNLEEKVLNEFRRNPLADIIIFNLDSPKLLRMKKNKKRKKLKFYNLLNYGAPRIAFRKEILERKNIHFSHMYGGGAKYSSGEDSLFLLDCIRNGLKIYTSPEIIGKLLENDSTWFEGYTEKFFFDKGVWIGNSFSRLKYLIVLYLSLRERKNGTWTRIFLLMIKGVNFYNRRS